jgi:hypothetical protein
MKTSALLTASCALMAFTPFYAQAGAAKANATTTILPNARIRWREKLPAASGRVCQRPYDRPGRISQRIRNGSTAEHGFRLLYYPSSDCTIWACLVPGRHRNRFTRQWKRLFHRPFQLRNLHRRAGSYFGPGRLQWTVPRRQQEPGNASGAALSPRPLV